MDSVFSQSVAANALLAGGYVFYKLVHRCLTSKCRYTRDDGFSFDLDGDSAEAPCAATDLQKIAELIQNRSKAYTTRRIPI